MTNEWRTHKQGACIAYTSKHVVSQLPGCLTGELPCITANDDGFLGEGCPADPTSAGPFKPKSVFALLAFAPKKSNISEGSMWVQTPAQSPDCGFA